MVLSPARSVSGRFRVPGDKSISHRAALLGAMATGTTRIEGFSPAQDCASTLRCLRGLGVALRQQGDLVEIEGRGLEAWQAPAGPLDAGNSGSTLRMLAGVLAGRSFRSVLTGDASLCRRPVERVAGPLRAMGARLTSLDGRPPLTIDGGALHAIEWTLPVASAQVKTAILLAGVQAQGRTTVLQPAASRDHTERLLPAFGVSVEGHGLEVAVQGPAPLHAARVQVPGDASSAAFLVVAALILPGSEVRIDGVLLNPERTAFLDVLRAMGADLEVRVEVETPEPIGSIVARSSALRGTDVPPELVPALVDEVPALAVAAAFASGSFRVRGASELRVKESDRIAAIVEGLGRLGARAVEHPDGLDVEGGRPLHGAALRSFGDHRIAMALAVAALAAAGESQLDDPDCVGVSFPGFFDLLSRARQA
jgi:3-phosphoshikimate 1-carboxyvinyltransferase